jgi:acetoacetyl-CoA synthetase
LPFKWFEGALLNYAENLLRYDDEKIAIYSYGEAFTQVKSISFRDLKYRVKLYQLALKKSGVKKGDFVAGIYE